MAMDGEGSSRKNPFAGLLSGLTEFVDKLNQLAEKGQELTRSGSFDLGGAGQGQKPVRGVYGLSVKMGLGGEGPTVEPFGNIRRDRETGEPVVEDVREPLVDVFDEGDHLMVLAEMPGVEAQDIRIDLEGREMDLSADRGTRRYHKRFELPWAADRNTLRVSEKNGIVEILCGKHDGAQRESR